MHPLLTLHRVALATLALMAASSAPAVADEIPTLFGHKTKSVPPRIYPVLENRYIKQFTGPTISQCGPCFGFHKTQWRSWADACGEPQEATPTRMVSVAPEEAPAPADADKKDDKNGNGEKKDDKKPDDKNGNGEKKDDKKTTEKNTLLAPPPAILIPKVDPVTNVIAIPVLKPTMPISIPVANGNSIVPPSTLAIPQLPIVQMK